MANSGAINDGITDVSAANSTIIVSGAPNITLKANVGTTAGTVAAGNDSRFSAIAAPASSAPADLAAAAAVGTSDKYAREDHKHKRPTPSEIGAVANIGDCPGILVLGASDPIPGGTPAGTLIVRTP